MEMNVYVPKPEGEATMRRDIAMETNVTEMGGMVALLLCAGMMYAADLEIKSFDSSGSVRWTSPSVNATCRVEWASSLAGPWFSSWTNQQAVFATTVTNEVPVAMYYRVVCEVPDPHFPDITTTQSLDLVTSWGADTNFAVLDVRTAGEYAASHITNAVNIDYYAADFSTQLDALNKNQVYLIYCASGNRSGNAHDTMLGLGFHEVYNMLGGFNAFQVLPGASAYIE